MEAMVKVQNLSTFYRDKGVGEEILVLHGWGASLNSWKKFQDILSERGFRVVVPDLPGFGKSDKPKTEWSLEDYVEYLDEFTKKVRLNKFTVLGHSFGGVLATKFAVEKKKKVKNLILVSTLGATRKKSALIKTFLFVTKIKDVLWPLPDYTFFKSIKKKTQRVLGGGRVAPKGSAKMKNSMANILKNSLLPLFKKVECPTLILWGEKDSTSSVSEAFLIHQKIPSSHLHVFRGLPHALNLRAPHKLVQQVEEFLKEQEGSANYADRQNLEFKEATLK